MYELCIKNGLIVNADHTVKADIYVKDGKVRAITSGDVFAAEKTIDADGRFVMPGFIDPHAHMNDPPGGDISEDFYSGTCSAAAGGITTAIEMPLTMPVVATAEIFDKKRKICEAKAVVDFCMIGACIPGNIGELDEMLHQGAVAFKSFTAYSPEIPMLDDASLWKAMQKLADTGTTLSVHCENSAMVSEFTKDLIKQGKTKPCHYNEARPEIAELEAVQRVALFAYKAKARVHIVHCSVPEAVDTVSYFKSLGADISVETCMHYLTLNEHDVDRLGVYCICNPPIRMQATQDKLWERVLDGKVDFVGTDHSAYLHSEKAPGKKNIFDTPAGITGMQLCFPVFFDEAVNKRGLPVERFVEMSSTAAAKRYGIFPKKGMIEVNADADFVIFDPHKKWTVESAKLFYLEKCTPHEGRTVTGNVDETIVRGKTVYKDGKITTDAGYGLFIPAPR